MFNSNNPSEESLVDLSIFAEASRKAALAVLQPADHIEVFQGAESLDLEGQKIDLSGRTLERPHWWVAVSDTGSTPSTSNVNAALLGFHRRKDFGQDRTSFAASGRREKAVSGHGP
ncbi:hypothetical protein EV368DRAFT_90066 [Lentinula lateritia]|nr:hypothetical protein EV368DRAFT_90066 [Lentinula lateritia]